MLAAMLDIIVDDHGGWPQDIDWQKLAERTVAAALSQTPHAALASAPLSLSISIALSDDTEVQQLNAQYRAKDKPTNVLSFPMIQHDLLASLANTDDGEALLGDIILAQGTCRNEAEGKQISLEQHASHLMIHGMLHLLGYDHIEDAEAEAMETLEIKALASLGLPNPYSDNAKQHRG